MATNTISSIQPYQKRLPHLHSTASLPSPVICSSSSARSHPAAGHQTHRGWLLIKFSSNASLNLFSRSLSSCHKGRHLLFNRRERVNDRNATHTSSLMMSISSITMRHRSVPFIPWHVMICFFSCTSRFKYARQQSIQYPWPQWRR